jgi:hypothetical protein
MSSHVKVRKAVALVCQDRMKNSQLERSVAVFSYGRSTIEFELNSILDTNDGAGEFLTLGLSPIGIKAPTIITCLYWEYDSCKRQ